MSSLHEIAQLEAEANYYRDRVALLRARLYRRAIGSNSRLEELERALARAQRLLREARHGSAP